jgi:anti-sigma B factor antagonist
MELKILEKSGIVIIRIVGKTLGGPDATQVSEKMHELINSGKNKLAVDMSSVERMNSSGLGILIGCLMAVRKKSGDIRLFKLQEKPRELLRMTKLNCVFEVFEKEDEAVESFT